MNVIENLVGMNVVGFTVRPGVVNIEFTDAELSVFDTLSWVNAEDHDGGYTEESRSVVSWTEVDEQFLTIGLEEGSKIIVDISGNRFVESAVLMISGRIIVFPD